MRKIFSLLLFWFLVSNSFATETSKTKFHLLLLSNTQNEGAGPLEHAIPAINAWRGKIETILFIPFASKDENASTEKARVRLAKEGVKVIALTADESGRKKLESAEAVYVGGGNTFRLLKALQKNHFLEILRRRVTEGLPYLGSSAGANIISPTIKTTNDMPIIAPENFNALNILPFQINVHFFDPIKGMPGETREDRLLEYFEDNSRPVLAMRQGAWITVDGDVIVTGGAGVRVFRKGDKHTADVRPGEPAPREYQAGTRLNFQLNPL